jgi:hypothetical protein
MATIQVPADLWALNQLVVRPRDLAAIYARPDHEIARLHTLGALRLVAHGYWVVPPTAEVGNARWRPSIEDLALGLAAVDYGARAVALMGVSAARRLGAIPRALAAAVIATPKQRPALETAFGTITFVTRDVQRLQLVTQRGSGVAGYCTTVEQTVLDLADRPALGGLVPHDAAKAIKALGVRADWGVVHGLAAEQHKPAAYVRARWCAGAAGMNGPELKTRRPVPALGLAPIDTAARAAGMTE